MTKKSKLIAGNWKMNGLRADGVALALDLCARAGQAPPVCEILLCPPATLLHEIGAVFEGEGGAIALGAQDCHGLESGAHTGDISAPMLKDQGCTYIIVGHSERRADHGESDETVRAKASAVLGAGMAVIICIGETEAERDSGRAAQVVSGQLSGSLPEGASAENTIIAYEPVWAIGTGRTPTLAQVVEIHAAIRAKLGEKLASPDDFRILYGGSVKPETAAELMAVENVDGALVGGASLKAADFRAIITACS